MVYCCEETENTYSETKIVGAQMQSEAKIKGVTPKTKAWHIFVGKLDPDTIEDDLITFLSDQGIMVTLCNRPYLC